MSVIKSIFSRRNFLVTSGLGVLGTACSRYADFDTMGAQVKDRSRHPIVVIGAGLGGLTAGVYLAKQGFPVTVVEQHHIPGGYATSFERGRFNFEVSLHQTAAHNSAVELVLRELGLWDELEPSMVAAPELCRIVTPNHDITLPQADPDGYVEELSRLFPEERDGIRSLVDMMLHVSKDVQSIPDKLGFFDKLGFSRKHPEIWDLKGKTFEQVLDGHIENSDLRSIISVFWGYYGLPPSKLSAWYYVLPHGEYFKGGYYYKPRSQKLSDTLADFIERSGGKMIMNTRVEGIEMTDRTVSGVRIEGGEVLPADSVISNANVPDTINKLLPKDAVPRGYRAELASHKPSVSSFIVWLGLNRDIRDRLDTYETFISNSHDPDASYLACMNADAKNADIAVNVYDNILPNYSQRGTSHVTLFFCCGFEPWKKFQADYDAGNKDGYNAEKERLARVLIERTEKTLIPGLSDMIETQVTASPLTNKYFTSNPHGELYGFEQSVDNSFVDRVQNRTPIKGLYLASAWGSPGGGFGGVQYGARQAVFDLLCDLG